MHTLGSWFSVLIAEGEGSIYLLLKVTSVVQTVTVCFLQLQLQQALH